MTHPVVAHGPRRVETPFRILVVCTGNVCRSPIAERLLAHALSGFVAAHALDWRMPSQLTVESAGTRALVGSPMTEESAVLVSRTGACPSGHLARPLDSALIDRAGLILAVTRDHRRRVVAMAPAASRRVFGLVEFARLLEDVANRGDADLRHAPSPPQILAELVGAAAARRGFIEQPLDPTAEDIEDPFRRSSATYERVYLQLTTAICSITESLERLERTTARPDTKAGVR